MGTTIAALYIWSTVAMAGRIPASRMEEKDWVHQGQYASMTHCEKAIGSLYGKLDPSKARCVDTGIKVSK